MPCVCAWVCEGTHAHACAHTSSGDQRLVSGCPSLSTFISWEGHLWSCQILLVQAASLPWESPPPKNRGDRGDSGLSQFFCGFWRTRVSPLKPACLHFTCSATSPAHHSYWFRIRSHIPIPLGRKKMPLVKYFYKRAASNIKIMVFISEIARLLSPTTCKEISWNYTVFEETKVSEQKYRGC